MPNNQYLKALSFCRSPRKAATYIRAFEATVSGCGSPFDIAHNLRRAEIRAQTLEAPWRPNEESEGGPMPLHVMRQMLSEWGYI